MNRIRVLIILFFFIINAGAAFSFPYSDLLYSPEKVKSMMNDKNLVIVDTRNNEKYLAGHIEGAVNLDTIRNQALNGSKNGIKMMLRPAREVVKALAEKGITLSKKVVIYEDGASWGSDGRLFWILEMLGHKDVHILNGGYNLWKSKGYLTSGSPTSVDDSSNFADVTAYDISRLADAEYIAGKLGSKDVVIIDNRTREEFDGAILHEEKRGGHIPGAINLYYMDVMNDDYTVKPYEEIIMMLKALSIPADDDFRKNGTVVTMCTGGIRSGHGYFIFRLLGYEKVRNYDGSWFDWATRTDLPLEKKKEEGGKDYGTERK